MVKGSDEERSSSAQLASNPRSNSPARARRTQLVTESPRAGSDPESNARLVKKHDYGLPSFVRRESLSTNESHSRSRSRGSEGRNASGSSTGLPREDSSSSYAASGFPGMSGIGPVPASVYGSSPPVAASNTATNASGSGFHFPRFGGSTSGAESSGGSGFAGSGFRTGSRSRQTSQREKLSFTSPKIGAGSGSDGSYPSKGSKAGTSSGTSNSNSSAWNFFRSASSIHLPRHKHSDSFSSIQENSESLLSPTISTPGVTTPQVTKSGLSTPLGIPDLNEEIHRRMNATTSLLKQDMNKSAIYTVLEAVPATNSSTLGSKRRGKRSANTATSPLAPIQQKADGLVSIVSKVEQDLDSSKVAVAGRNTLRVLSIKHTSDGEGDFASEIADEERYSRSNPRKAEPKVVQIKEDVDVLAGLQDANGRKAKAALINDVGWGYESTSNKLLTGHSNGSIAVYDLAQAGSKLERLVTQHLSGRGVNVVAFGGVNGQGTLLASACQDGDIIISDLRHHNKITLAHPLDPVRSICFAPRFNTTADPFHLISATESGHIYQWDLRQPNKPLDRLMAHSGGALSLDWKGAVSELAAIESGSPGGDAHKRSVTNDSRGWLASAGMDGTVKIWDMSTHNHTPRLLHTLEARRPVNFVRWHASSDRPCDIVVTPLSAGPGTSPSEDSWQPDIEIWDVRRPYLPKQTFYTGGGTVSCLSPAVDTDVLWALNRSSSAFQQIDVEREAVQPLDYVPRVATAWNIDGTLAFAVKDQDAANIVGPSLSLKETPHEASLPINQSTGLVAGLDPDFDIEAFRYLANIYQTQGKTSSELLSACEHNAEVAGLARSYRAAEVWRVVGQWLTDEADITPQALDMSAMTSSMTSTATSPDRRRKHAPHASQTLRRTRSQTSPSTPLQHFQQREHTSKQSSPLVTSQILSEADISPRALPARLPSAKKTRQGQTNHVDLVGSDTSNSSSIASQDDADTRSAVSSSSPSEDEPEQVGGGGSIVSINPALSMSALLSKKRPALAAMSRSNTSDGFFPMAARSTSGSGPTTEHSLTPRASVPPTPASRQMALPLHEVSAAALARRASAMPGSSSMSRHDSCKTQTRFPSRKNSDESSISSDDDGKTGDEDPSPEAMRARPRKKLSMISGKPGHRACRSKTRRRVVSNTEPPGTRRGSKEISRSVSGKRGRVLASTAAMRMQQHNAAQQQSAAQDLHDMLKEHLQNTIQDLANDGDVQTSAVMAILLREALGIHPVFLARITAAYLSLLRQTDCHLPSATVLKNSVIPAVREESQTNTTIRTACGNCERGIHEAPFGKCRKCAATPTFCSICHVVGTGFWTFCPTCGHGAHEQCLDSYAFELSLAHEGAASLVDLDSFTSKKTSIRSTLTPSATAPSSPQLLFPSEQALFHTNSAVHSRMHSRAVSPEPFSYEAMETRTILLSQCPSGCGHSCLLTLPLANLAAQAAERSQQYSSCTSSASDTAADVVHSRTASSGYSYLPGPIREAISSLIGSECYTSLIWNLDISDTKCIKYSVSKALGLGLVAGGAIVKVPQIVKILTSGSAKGLSLVSYLLDTASVAIVVAYNARQYFPFSTYGENVFLGIQNVVIMLLIVAYSRTSAKPLKMTALLGVFIASAYLLFSESITPIDILRKLLALSIPLSLSSKVPQIAKIYSTGSTGQLSAFLVFNSLAGCLARVFTTATETGDRTLWWSFVSASALNAVLAAQMLWYWKDSNKMPVKRLAEKVQAHPEKSRHSQPVAVPAVPVAATPAKPASNVGVAPRSAHKSAGRSASTRYTRKVD